MLAPTLIVGLGGKGSDIVNRVSKLASAEQKKRISFVIFDTDVNELNQIRFKNDKIKAIQTSTKMTVGEYLNIDTNARDNWFPVNKILSRKTLTEGAGQVRAISRLALETSIRAGSMEPLHKAIDELFKLDTEKTEQALRVIIVSSLAGGTGSGLILPVSMYIKNYLDTHFQQSATIIRGFFILPEVFFEVIHGQAERNNLNCNAYATLRELDAFLMKGDGTLPEKYKRLNLTFPRIGSRELENYEVMPLDFAFLFDAQNIDGKKLNSFEEYLNHAASCIFAQSISPMNKRSSSSEDNVIRELVKSSGRNRYAGAGSAILRYPFEDIKRYIALLWAKDSLSKSWLEVDLRFKKENSENQQLRNQGFNPKQLDRGEHYIRTIQAEKANLNAFAMNIHASTHDYDESGFNEIGIKWESYLDNLRSYVQNNATNSQIHIDDMKNSCLARFGNLNDQIGDNRDYQNLLNELHNYKRVVQKNTELVGRSMAFSLFQSSGDPLKQGGTQRLETYIQKEGHTIHPNAVRYFLYNLAIELERAKSEMNHKIKRITDFWKNFEFSMFDLDDTVEVETAQDFINKKIKDPNLWQKIFKQIDANRQKVMEDFNHFFENTNSYRLELVYSIVIEEAIKYTRKLRDAFESFYNSFEKSFDSLNLEIESIANRYENTQGQPIRHVCATKKCLDKFASKAVFAGNSIDLEPELCDTIYRQIHKYAMEEDKPNDDSYFIKIFDSDMMNYYRKSVMTNYGQLIDMDIISALETEAEFEKGIYDFKKKEHYIAEVIKTLHHLAQPFIEAPLGEQRRIIDACAFNKKMVEEAPKERKDLIDLHLFNKGGVTDDDIDKYMIIFYKAIYGLRANDLSKFAPPLRAETMNREAGSYFKAYFELISQIKPETHKTAVITPHIDRHWHLLSRLPDLDESNQLQQERRIYSAMFYGLLTGMIDYKNIATNKQQYRLFINGSAEDLVVSNHTPCDHYYEILDALITNPIVVDKIMDAVQVEREYEKHKMVAFESSMLKKQLDRLQLLEFSEDTRSIFDIIFLLKKSTPFPEYHEQDAENFFLTLLDEIKQYMAQFYEKDELNYQFGMLLLKQYQMFRANIRGIIRDTLLDSMVSMLIHTLKNLGMPEDAEYIQAEFRKYVQQKTSEDRVPNTN
jgi:hypothetical protein